MNKYFKFFDTEKADHIRMVLGIGVFDGVHLGHRRIMECVVALAAQYHAQPGALTFDPHPRSVLQPGAPPLLLLPLKERIALLREAGARYVGVAHFTSEFAAMTPEMFVDSLLGNGEFELAGICVGEHWRFGRGGSGNCTLLAEVCRQRGIAFQAVPELKVDDEVVSSSTIRRSIGSGRLEHAEKLLGRRYRLFGVVESGYGAATQTLNCPTANLAMKSAVLPPDGVYAGWVYYNEKRLAAIVNIGFSPTFGWKTERRRVEVHLLNFSGNLYGADLALELIMHIREERVFESPDALKQQIAVDLSTVKNIFQL